ncbi:DNA double-strand break repair nuclease NurA [Chloroflexota bacterium]
MVLNRLLLHPNFAKTLEELREKDIFLPHLGYEVSPHNLDFQTSGQLLSNLEEIKPYRLDPNEGCNVTNDISYCAYDESIMKFSALEGAAYFTAHSLIVVGGQDYIPVTLAVFNFYTRSNEIVKRSSYIKFAEEPEIEFKRNYLKDRLGFLLEYTPKRSVLLIDGPLIGGDLYTIIVDSNHKFLEKEIIPIYIVKNSNSNIVTEQIPDLQGKYNSDLHWLNSLLSVSERSSFFKYEDQVNKKNAKVFCYIKPFNAIPQRIEMHVETYYKYKDSIQNILNMILYLFLVQGSKTNPQIRTIAIAEAYARSILKYIDINKYFKEAKISPTLNQIRFGG